MHKKFTLDNVFFKYQIFSFFLIVQKMITSYAEICRVGGLEADFQQVLFDQFS